MGDSLAVVWLWCGLDEVYGVGIGSSLWRLGVIGMNAVSNWGTIKKGYLYDQFCLNKIQFDQKTTNKDKHVLAGI